MNKIIVKIFGRLKNSSYLCTQMEKQLDKLDIESLGWKLIFANNTWMQFENGKGSYLTLHNTKPNIGIAVGINNLSQGRISIQINNKSELKILMKQLGIYETNNK